MKMIDAKEHKVALEGLDSLRKAVRSELERKAKLGYNAVIEIDGKPAVVPAADVLEWLKGKERAEQSSR